MDNRPIGIFDSGLGGLTCVKKVMEIMPGEDIIYFGDTGRVPYGTKSPDTIAKYAKQIISFLEDFDIKFIIIACGTASSAALPNIRSEIKTEIIGVLEPTCKMASELTNNNRVGVLGTQGTINSDKYRESINKINPDIEVFSCACPMFVPLVENGYTEGEVTRLIVEEYLTPIKEKGVDTLILGCTHYPLLRKEIQNFMGENVQLVDSGAAAAVAAKTYFQKEDMLCDTDKKGSAQYYVSDSVAGFEELGSAFLDRHIEGSVHKIDIEKY